MTTFRIEGVPAGLLVDLRDSDGVLIERATVEIDDAGYPCITLEHEPVERCTLREVLQ